MLPNFFRLFFIRLKLELLLTQFPGPNDEKNIFEKIYIFKIQLLD